MHLYRMCTFLVSFNLKPADVVSHIKGAEGSAPKQSCWWVWGFSETTVNYRSHADSTADCTQHNAHTFGVAYI